MKNEITIYNEKEVQQEKLKEETEDLSLAISKCTNPEELEDLYNKFKVSNIKKEVFRLNKLNTLLDTTLDVANERITYRRDELSNKEIVDYMNAFQGQIEKTNTSLNNNSNNVNLYQQNNTANINVNIDNSNQELSRESREKILSLVKDILKDSNNNNQEDKKEEDGTETTDNS